MKVSVVRWLHFLNACIYHSLLQKCRQTVWPRGLQAAEDVAGFSLHLFDHYGGPTAALQNNLGQSKPSGAAHWVCWSRWSWTVGHQCLIQTNNLEKYFHLYGCSYSLFLFFLFAFFIFLITRAIKFYEYRIFAPWVHVNSLENLLVMEESLKVFSFQ